MTQKALKQEQHQGRSQTIKKTGAKTRKQSRIRLIFARFCEKFSQVAGHPLTFFIFVILLIVWVIWGIADGYSEEWHNMADIPITVSTFLFVFLIQNAQNRETRAMQLKIDELIRSTKGAKNSMLQVETLSDEELKDLCDQYRLLSEEAEKRFDKSDD